MSRSRRADLRIIDEPTANAIDRELSRRSTGKGRSGNGPRARYLLSGLIKCGVSGSSLTLAGKDYYRCAGHRERHLHERNVSQEGTSRAGRADRAPIGAADGRHGEALRGGVWQGDRAQAARRGHERCCGRQRLAELDREIEALSQNLLAGVLGPTITRMLTERETEKSRVEVALAEAARPKGAAVLAQPVLLKRFEKVSDLRTALNDPAIHTEAVDLIQDLLESVTIHPGGAAGPEAEVVAETSRLLAFANEKAPVARAWGRLRY